MIKRYTPNKNININQANTSCCSFCFQEEILQERSITFKPKLLPPTSIHTSKNTPTNHIKPYNVVNAFFLTPKTSTFPIGMTSSRKADLFTASTQQYSAGIPPAIDDQMEQIQFNPIPRLKKRFNRKTSIPFPLNESTAHHQPISRYLSLQQKQYISIHQLKPSSILIPKLAELEQKLEESLQKQIEDFKDQYQQLLVQFKRLKFQKQTNYQYYCRLLAEIEKKKQQIGNLQRLRREQIEVLRVELENYMQQKGI